MAWAFAALVVGVLLAMARVLPERAVVWAGRVTTAGLAALLFSMGARMGADAAIRASLATLGLRAAVLAAAAVTGSVLAVWGLARAGSLTVGGEEPAKTPANDGETAGAAASLLPAKPSGRMRLGTSALVLVSVTAGVVSGALGLLPAPVVGALGPVSDAALGAILLGVGLEIGQGRTAWRGIRRLGARALLLPAGVVVGSLAGALVAGAALSLPPNESTAVSAGFGWYSLAGVLLTEIHDVPTGALAFLTNVFRELIAAVAMPLLVGRLGAAAAIAPGGATTMDTTLPVVARSMGSEAALLAFASGAILTALAPVLMSLLIRQ